MGRAKMSEREPRRVSVLGQLDDGRIDATTAAQVTALSRRQAFRFLRRLRDEGPSALAHRARGRTPNSRIGDAVREILLDAVREEYADLGPTLAADTLAERHGLRCSVRRCGGGGSRIGCGPRARSAANSIGPACAARVRANRSRSTARTIAGSRIAGQPARCSSSATTRRAGWWGCGSCLPRRRLPISRRRRATSPRMGAPSHSTPTSTPCSASGAVSRRPVTGSPSSVARWRSWASRSSAPTAARPRGVSSARTARCPGRLVMGLRLEGISDMTAANAFLPAFVERYDRRLAKTPRRPDDLHRPLDVGPDPLRTILCMQEHRHVGAQLSFRFERDRVILDETKVTRGPMCNYVEMLISLDGDFEVCWNGMPLSHRTFSKNRKRVTQTSIVADKNLSAVLEHIMAEQGRRSLSRTGSPCNGCATRRMVREKTAGTRWRRARRRRMRRREPAPAGPG